MSSDYRKLKECINRIKETTTLRGSPRPGLPLATRINNGSEIIDIGGPQSNSSPTSSTTVQGSEAEARVVESRLNLPVLSLGVSSRAQKTARVSFQDGPPGPHQTSLRINPCLGRGTSSRTPPLATSWGRIQEEHGKEMETNDPPSPIDLPSPIIRDPFGDGVQSASFDQPVQGLNDIENSPNLSMWTNRSVKVICQCRFSHNAAEVQMFSPASTIRSCGILSLDAHDLETPKF